MSKEGFPDGLLLLKAGSAALSDLDFSNGTIEYDFKPLAADMPGIQFRVAGPPDTPDGEEVYLRMFGEERASDDGMQYAPMIHGFMLWNTYPQYQHSAPLINGWNHVKLVVSGARLAVYINRSPDPVLSVGELQSHSAHGALRLRGPAVYTNLTVSAGDVAHLSPIAEPDPTSHDRNIVRAWQLSELQPIESLATPAYARMPQSPASWKPVTTERGGLLNLDRQYISSRQPPGLGWLRFNAYAPHAETRHAAMGWIGAAWIYVNGVLVTSGKNFYEPEQERRSPDGRLALSNGSFDLPLQAGNNEIAIALYASVQDRLQGRTPYGWGLMMRFDALGDVQLKPSAREAPGKPATPKGSAKPIGPV